MREAIWRAPLGTDTLRGYAQSFIAEYHFEGPPVPGGRNLRNTRKVGGGLTFAVDGVAGRFIAYQESGWACVAKI